MWTWTTLNEIGATMFEDRIHVMHHTTMIGTYLL